MISLMEECSVEKKKQIRVVSDGTRNVICVSVYTQRDGYRQTDRQEFMCLSGRAVILEH
jgi:hypothetical protein